MTSGVLKTILNIKINSAYCPQHQNQFWQLKYCPMI